MATTFSERGGAAVELTELTDTPASYSGHGDKVLSVKTDASGVEFTALAATAAVVAFKAYDSSGGSTLISGAILPLDATHFNIGSHYDTSTYKFTAPTAGLYEFGWNAWSDDPDQTSRVVSLVVNTTNIIRPGNSGNGECFTSLVVLAVDDEVYMSTTGYAIHYFAGVTWNEFYGHYIGPSS